MKKITLFITIILSIFLLGNNLVHAEGFYEGEYINNIWMVRKNSKRLIYQTARFLKRSSDNQFAYCVEPFTIINAQQGYTEIDPNTISPNTWERVSLLAYYGYGYGNHTDPKWYPITQIMIWKAIDPSSDFYFTDSLNGNRINIFQAEMAEIESLIQRYYTQPSFANQE